MPRLSETAPARIAPHAPHGLAGAITLPPSKSITQRALVTAARSGEGSRVVRPLDAEDPRLLAAALQAAGFELAWEGGEVRRVRERAGGSADIHMGNNGTGVRFMLAQLASLPGEWRLDGIPRLRERPLGALVTALRQLGADIVPAAGTDLRLPLRISGRELNGSTVEVDPSESSQFVSALMLLGATLPGGLEVRLTSPPPSRPYVDLTVAVLRSFGSEASFDDVTLTASVSGGALRPAAVVVEGDWSAAAFPSAAVAIAGGEVELVGVSRASPQGDVRIVDILGGAGCGVAESDHGVVVRGPASRPLRADLRATPDLFPALAVVVAAVGGKLSGLEGLSAKESDRAAVMTANLNAIGFAVSSGGGAYAAAATRPRRCATSEPLPSADDHRIAMAMAVAGSVVPGVTISDPDCVAKSWPGFWDDWRTLFPEPR